MPTSSSSASASTAISHSGSKSRYSSGRSSVSRTLNLNDDLSLDQIDSGEPLTNGTGGYMSTSSSSSSSSTSHKSHNHYHTNNHYTSHLSGGSGSHHLHHHHLNHHLHRAGSTSSSGEPIASEKIEKLNYKYKSQLPPSDPNNTTAAATAAASLSTTSSSPTSISSSFHLDKSIGLNGNSSSSSSSYPTATTPISATISSYTSTTVAGTSARIKSSDLFNKRHRIASDNSVTPTPENLD